MIHIGNHDVDTTLFNAYLRVLQSLQSCPRARRTNSFYDKQFNDRVCAQYNALENIRADLHKQIFKSVGLDIDIKSDDTYEFYLALEIETEKYVPF